MKRLYALAAACMPSILLFNLYNGNVRDSEIIFGHVAILAAALTIVGLAMYFAICGFLGREGAVLYVAMCWACRSF